MPDITINPVSERLVTIAGFGVPERFEAKVTAGDFKFTGDISVSTGEPRLLSATLDYGDTGMGLSDFGSKSDHVRRCVEQAFILAMTTEPLGVLMGGDESNEVTERVYAADAKGREFVRRKPGAPKLSDEFLLEAAAAFSSSGWRAVKKPNGDEATERTARRYLQVARERGLVR